MAGRLDGKTVLITGGARGQGAAHGRRLSQEGAAVVLGDILDDAGEEHARSLRDAGHDVRYLRLDVTPPNDWDAAVRAAESRFGRLHVLVNNAGVVRVAPVVEESDDGWQATMAVNATGPFYGMRAAIPALRRSGGGAIVKHRLDLRFRRRPRLRRLHREQGRRGVRRHHRHPAQGRTGGDLRRGRLPRSGDAVYITGAELAVDSGYLAR